MSKLNTKIRWLKDGERANAANLNRPLEDMTNYIQSSLGTYEIDPAKLNSEVQPGDFVYIDPNDGIIKKSIKNSNGDTQTQNVIGRYLIDEGNPDDDTDDIHTILLSGMYSISEDDEEFRPGSPYYLSSTEPGKMTHLSYDNAVLIGRALSERDFIIDIKGYNYVPPLEPLTIPTISKSIDGFDMTISITGFDDRAVSHTWVLEGDYTIISGNKSGTLNGSIVLRANNDTTLSAMVMSEADNKDNVGSDYSEKVSEYIEVYTVLEKPSISSVSDELKITFTIENPDSNALSYTWEITGDYTLDSGTLEGSTDTTITIEGQENDSIDLKVIAIGDGDDYVNSEYSDNIHKTFSTDPSEVYNTSLVDGETKEGIKFTDPDDAPVSTFYFDAKTYDDSTAAVVMFFKTNERTSKLDYAPEYNDEVFEVTLDGDIYQGTFAENSDYNNPTVIPVK